MSIRSMRKPMTDKLIHEEMLVTCSSCHTTTVTNDIKRFKEVNHTYPPTVLFVCGECGNESVVYNYPKRIVGRLINRILKERGFNATPRFDRGIDV